MSAGSGRSLPTAALPQRTGRGTEKYGGHGRHGGTKWPVPSQASPGQHSEQLGGPMMLTADSEVQEPPPGARALTLTDARFCLLPLRPLTAPTAVVPSRPLTKSKCPGSGPS